jgi:putative oxidoreductase
MSIKNTASFYVLGFIFMFFGLNGLLHNAIMQAMHVVPPPMPEQAMAFIGAMMATPYFTPLLASTQILCGFGLFFNIARPLFLVVLAPVIVQIFCFHAFLTPGFGNVILPIIIGLLEIISAWQVRSAFAPLFGKQDSSCCRSC